MLTVGAPMWGSIKPFFPLTFGIEGIGASALDAFVGNEDLKDSMRNFSGAYHLLADDNFGQWLTVDGAARNQAGVKAFLESVGGNGVLFEDGRKTHQDHVDGWLDYDGRIDVRAVVGVGLLTTRHVKVTQDAQEGDADVEVAFADGDITVPAHSAWQGEPGGAHAGRPDPPPAPLQHRAHGPDQGPGRAARLHAVPALRAHAAQAARSEL